MIRLFAAIPLPDEISEGLTRRMRGIPGARWRRLDQLHITVRFFGEVSEPVAAEIDAELRGVAARQFDLELTGVGAFGEGAEIRAVWAGVDAPSGLTELARKCERAARRAGLPPEPRTFRPHVTLAYLRRPDPIRAAAWIQGHNLLRSPPFRVTWFGLWSSWTSPDASRYDLEREYPLS